MIDCRTLGPVEVMVNAAAAMPELLWRKHLALLVYLARSAPRPRTREHLSALLWPDKPEEAARHSLVEATRVLRRHAGEAAVQTVAGQVRLSPGAAHLDLDEFADAMRRGDWEAAARLVSGEFMEGFTVPGASRFEDWLAAERTHWRDRSVEALLQGRSHPARSGCPAAETRGSSGVDPAVGVASAAGRPGDGARPPVAGSGRGQDRSPGRRARHRGRRRQSEEPPARGAQWVLRAMLEVVRAATERARILAATGGASNPTDGSVV